MSWGRWKELLIWVLAAHEMSHNVDRDWEDDGAVVLGRNAVQGLQIAELSRRS